MKKTVIIKIIKEDQTKNLMPTNDWPYYFHPEVNGGMVRLLQEAGSPPLL